MSTMLQGSEPSQHSIKSNVGARLRKTGNLQSSLRSALSNSQRRVTKWWVQTHLQRLIDRELPGWRLTVASAILLGSLAFLSNLTFIMFLLSKRKAKWRSNGIGTLYEGDCHKVDRLYKIAKVAINIISTLLVVASNSCMQLLVAPTRCEVDKAHSRRQWVHIGIPSFRNVWKHQIGHGRIFCWIILAVCSIPLHLLWNSVVIFSPTTYRYNQLTVTEGFTRLLPFDDSALYDMQDSDEVMMAHFPDNIHLIQQSISSGTYTNLSISDCKHLYSQWYIRDRSDVIIVVEPKEQEYNTSMVLGSATAGWGWWPYRWMCPAEINNNFQCRTQLLQTPNEWLFPNYENPRVLYCLSSPKKERCKLEYGLHIIVITAIVNFIKVCCFCATYLLMKKSGGEETKDVPLLTTGDALASFLERPDPYTKGMSTAEKKDFENGIWSMRWMPISSMVWMPRLPQRLFRAIGTRRWLIDMLLIFAIWVIPLMFLLSQLDWFQNHLFLDWVGIWSLGLGKPSGLFLVGRVPEQQLDKDAELSARKFMKHVILANLPQLYLTGMYYLWNCHLQCMLAARSYSKFAARDDQAQKDHPIVEREDETERCEKHRAELQSSYLQVALTEEDAQEVAETEERSKQSFELPRPRRGLRVTYPSKAEGSQQRSTHFLTIPLKYWLINTSLQLTLHMILSQAFFFARINILDHWEELTKNSVNQVSYSVLGLILLVVVAFVTFVINFCISLEKFDNRMPLAATCSGALSAACHPHNTHERHHEKLVHYGIEEIKDENHDAMATDAGDGPSSSTDSDKNRVNTSHCTFTSDDAKYPTQGHSYA